MANTIKKINPSDKVYGILNFPKAFDLSFISGKPILVKDSMGSIEGKVHKTINRIDGLTKWHKSRMTSTEDEISIMFVDNEIENGMNVIHIEFLNERGNSECQTKENNFSFALESQLEEFIIRNIEKLEDGLIVEKQQYKIGANKMDLLCIDKNRNYVIVEIKNRLRSDEVVGQILRYMGCLKEYKKIDKVRGIIIAPETDRNLDYAVSNLSDVSVKYFKLNIEFED